jgi:Domain of unknown function DUF29
MKPSPSELYDGDYYAWIQEQVSALRLRRIEEVDWDNVAEEIEDLGKSERWSFQGPLESLTEHLLKLAYTHGMARARNQRLWEGTAKLARLKIRRRLTESPSLRGKIADLFESAYRSGRIRALATTKPSETSLPTDPPWSLEQIMDDSFIPGPVR